MPKVLPLGGLLSQMSVGQLPPSPMFVDDMFVKQIVFDQNLRNLK
jgi:hypothetical protein